MLFRTVFSTLLILSGVTANNSPTYAIPKNKPNFVFIITDDQDSHLNSVDYMPILQKRIAEQGTTYTKHFCTIALCCPSRVSLLTGKMAHNTNVTDVAPPYGGYSKFIAQGLNDKYLPLFNGHSTTSWNNPMPGGWNGTGFFLDPGTYNYYNVTFQADQSSPVSRPDVYSTDLARDTALGFLDKASKAGGSFFIGVAPIAPHTFVAYDPKAALPHFTVPQPAVRHNDLYPGVKIPRGLNFNPDKASGASWIAELSKLNDTVIDYMDDFYRKRLQTLAAVDELVEAVVDKVEALGLSDNTYIIYTTDNGFHMGQHRMQPGKNCAYEEDIHIPFMIRGPGIPVNQSVNFVTSHTDIVPTLFKLAGMDMRDDFDGTPIPLTLEEQREAASNPLHDHVAVEFWGFGTTEGDYARMGPNGSYTQYPNNTYKAIRVVGKTYSLQYAVWCTNEHELYDMTVDPYQMTNLAASEGNLMGYSVSQVMSRLDALTMVMKSCKGIQCTLPWLTLHPEGNVNTIADAMSQKYDSFYANQSKVSFTSCEPGYIIPAEGPQTPHYYKTENLNDWH
ncbi:Arylsulphatase [Cadophora sp. DSE1049]|nr:Arylsulphatase [Cadophora sp. DSE1049]